MKVFAKEFKEEIAFLALEVAAAEDKLRSRMRLGPKFTVEPGLVFARYNPQTDCLDIEQNIPLNQMEIVRFFYWLSNLITEEPDPESPEELQVKDHLRLQSDISSDLPF